MLQPREQRLLPANHKILGAWHQSTLQSGGASFYQPIMRLSS